MGQLVFQRGTEAAGVVAAEAHADGDGVRVAEVHAVLVAGEDVGVVTEGLDGVVAVGALEGHRQMHRQVVARQKFHQLAQSRQGAEGGGQLLRLLGGDALDAAQLLRLLLDDEEGVRAETLHQTAGGGTSHALEDAGGQVRHRVLLAAGHPTLHALGGELGAVYRVDAPHAGDGHALAGGGAGDTAHHGDRLVLAVHGKEEDGVAVLLVVEYYAVYGALDGDTLAHGLTSPVRVNFRWYSTTPAPTA